MNWFPYTAATKTKVDWTQPPCMCDCHKKEFIHIAPCCHLPAGSVYIASDTGEVHEGRLDDFKRQWEAREDYEGKKAGIPEKAYAMVADKEQACVELIMETLDDLLAYRLYDEVLEFVDSFDFNRLSTATVYTFVMTLSAYPEEITWYSEMYKRAFDAVATKDGKRKTKKLMGRHKIPKRRLRFHELIQGLQAMRKE